jgi:hypothetical protein
LFGASAGIAGGQVEHPGQQPRGRAEPGDRPCLLLFQFGDHVKDPRIGPPEIGFGVAQHLEQPVNPGLGAILCHRGHDTILATTPDNFRARETTPRKLT